MLSRREEKRLKRSLKMQVAATDRRTSVSPFFLKEKAGLGILQCMDKKLLTTERRNKFTSQRPEMN